MSEIPRPSHADFTYQAKYGVKSGSGGGRSSARETIGRNIKLVLILILAGRVAAGAVAEKWLKVRFGIEIVAYVSSVGPIEADRSAVDLNALSREIVDQNIVRCPDLEAAEKMIAVCEANLWI